MVYLTVTLPWRNWEDLLLMVKLAEALDWIGVVV